MLLILLVFTGRPLVYAQLSVKGVVRDADNGQPIPNAAVFINTTTYGTVCNEDGVFELSAMPELPFELTIAAVGYERAQLQISRENVTGHLTIDLIPQIVALEGVEIRPPVSEGWLLYGAKFMDLFIGYSDFAAQCRILNEEVLDFYYDPNSFLLLVVASEPIKIENRATGYLVTYWLEDFEFSFLSGELFYKGQSQFKPLVTKRKARASRWADNRRSAYYGSLNHFIRSVYHGEVVADGFEIRAMKAMKQSDTTRFIHGTRDTFRFGNVEHLRLTAPEDTLPLSFRFGKDGLEGDTSELRRRIQRFRGNPDKEIRILYKEPIPLDSIRKTGPYGEVLLDFKDYLQVTYTKETAEEPYVERVLKDDKNRVRIQESVLSLRLAEPLLLQPDGNFQEPYNLFIESYWSYEKLDKLLPLDYRVEGEEEGRKPDTAVQK